MEGLENGETAVRFGGRLPCYCLFSLFLLQRDNSKNEETGKEAIYTLEGKYQAKPIGAAVQQVAA